MVSEAGNPGKRQLCGRDPFALRNLVQPFNDLEVVLESLRGGQSTMRIRERAPDLFGETIEIEAYISFRKIIPGLDLSRQKCFPERRVSNHCDAELFPGGNNYRQIGSTPQT